jgi:hypothetical protein
MFTSTDLFHFIFGDVAVRQRALFAGPVVLHLEQLTLKLPVLFGLEKKMLPLHT